MPKRQSLPAAISVRSARAERPTEPLAATVRGTGHARQPPVGVGRLVERVFDLEIARRAMSRSRCRWILLQAAPQQRPNRRRRRGRQRVQSGSRLQDVAERFDAVSPVERRVARQHLVQDARRTPRCPARLSTALPSRLLGAHVGGRPEDHAFPRAASSSSATA